MGVLVGGYPTAHLLETSPMIKDKAELALREVELTIAYRFIKKGSIKAATPSNPKITVVALCKKCKKERRLNSSDLFQSVCECGHRYNPHYGS